MSKVDKNTAKVNTITSEIQGFLMEFPPDYESDKESILSYFSAIICQLDTDIAISVMENFGKEGKNQALAIKVNYGY
jgi:hypothetical protein